jgi:hypothetical protein
VSQGVPLAPQQATPAERVHQSVLHLSVKDSTPGVLLVCLGVPVCSGMAPQCRYGGIGDTLGDVLHDLLVSFECPMVYFGGVCIRECVWVCLGVLLVW